MSMTSLILLPATNSKVPLKKIYGKIMVVENKQISIVICNVNLVYVLSAGTDLKLSWLDKLFVTLVRILI